MSQRKLHLLESEKKRNIANGTTENDALENVLILQIKIRIDLQVTRRRRKKKKRNGEESGVGSIRKRRRNPPIRVIKQERKKFEEFSAQLRITFVNVYIPLEKYQLAHFYIYWTK
jgi:hypothetical protein